jgi:hypothetical protein
MSEVYSYAFEDNIMDRRVDKSYAEPHDAYVNQNSQTRGKDLCLILNNKVVKIFATKLISVKWAIACTLHGTKNSDNMCRQALIAAKSWIKLVESGASVKELKFAEQNAKIAAYAIYCVFTNENAAAAYTADAAADTLQISTLYAATAAVSAVNYMTKSIRENEIRWQRKKLWEIISDPYFELSKINYHGNYNRLRLDRPFPFADLGPKIMEY